MDLTDLEIDVLYDLLAEEWGRNFDEPNRVDEETGEVLNELYDKIAELARSRDLWWTRGWQS